MEPDPKLDALGDELESLVAGLSQSPQQFLLNPGKGHPSQGDARGGPVNRSKSSTGSSRRPRPCRASQGAHGRDAGEENSGGSCGKARGLPPPRRPNPKRRTGLRIPVGSD